VLVGLFVLYIAIVIRGDVEESDRHVGVPAYFQAYPKVPRIAVILFGFLFSGAIIFTAVHPFAEGLEQLGLQYGIPEFFMIQWLAPLASESPELIVVAYLVNKARSTAGFNTLISSKLNQWTLLIGTLAIVYSISAGAVGTLSFDAKQAAEIWITAAQSFFAIAIIVNFEINVREAVVLLVLFSSQVLTEFYVIRTYAEPAATDRGEHDGVVRVHRGLRRHRCRAVRQASEERQQTRSACDFDGADRVVTAPVVFLRRADRLSRRR